MSYAVKTENFALTESQRQTAKSLGISETFMRLLLGRGFAESELAAYLHPSVKNMSSPYEIEGMEAAVARVRKAISEGQRILIYGDYDCDGICAVSILMLYLRDKAKVSYFIPDRNRDGYGISVSALERIISVNKPDLVITVDCGITAVTEVEYLKAHNIDTVVTDHHEPHERIPDCTVLDPKLSKRGFYDYCGAGVALKLVEALAGRDEACKYLDIAAIATVADVVPLKSDNRIIAYYGIKQMQAAPRKGIKMLLGDDAVTSQNIMFRLAPRMNAAGRLNSAMKVVELFLEDDYFMLKTLAEELIRDNAKRQELCEEVVREAKEMLRGTDFAHTGLIALYNENWEAGVIGIATSKLVEEFKRPAVLFAKQQDYLRGSARSVPSVNIFELFSNLSKYFISFGGHSQAAGVSLVLDKFEEFKTEANALILSEHTLTEFIPENKCEMKLPLDFDFLSFAKELALMEPIGYGNSRPSFVIEGNGLKFETMGYSKHVKCQTKYLDLVGFYEYAELLSPRTGRTDIEVSLDVNVFRNNVTAQGILKSVEFKDIVLTEDEADCLNLHHLDYEGGAYVSTVGADYIEKKLADSPFGTLIVCFSRSDYERACAMSDAVKRLPVFISKAFELNPRNAVVVCPCAEFDFGYYSDVILAGAPKTEGYKGYIAGATRCVAVGNADAIPYFATDDELRGIYKAVTSVVMGKVKATNLHALYLMVNERFKTSESKFQLAMKIFGQLGLVKILDRGIIEICKKSVALSDSKAYRNIAHIKN